MQDLNLDSSAYIKHVNKTSRHSGAVGKDPVCYKELDRVLEIQGGKGKRVLDFGCGKGGLARGFVFLEKHKLKTYIPYDIGANTFHKGSEEELAAGLAEPFDYVVLSNVLNVQPSEELVKMVLLVAWKHLKPGAMLIVNYPAKPRHNPMTDLGLSYILADLSGKSLAMELTRQRVYKLKKKPLGT